MKYHRLILICNLIIVIFAGTLFSQKPDTLVLRNGLAVQLPKGYTETIIAPNPIEAGLVLGKWSAPKEGEKVKFVNGEAGEWRAITANSDGWFDDSVFSGCYLSSNFEMDRNAIMILEAMGDEVAYVNGVPRAGNPYGLSDTWESWAPHFDYSQLPIQLEKGKNNLLFRCQRGRLKVKVYPPKLPIMLNPYDITMPDLIAGNKTDMWGAVVIINSTRETLKNLQIKTIVNQNAGDAVPVPIIQPLSVRKVSFHLSADPITVKGKVNVTLALLRRNQNKEVLADSISISARVLNLYDNHKETFISKVDGTVQYYGIFPASETSDNKPKALFLSLHGAGVEAINQTGSYYPKTWGNIVAPTNRRPYGFNWEEWGRCDAMETIEIVKSRYKTDESRIYLTGHSMGGHGVWHIGSLYPDQFAAIGPSAGWISFWTYRFLGQDILDTTDIRRMIRRATGSSEAFMHIENYKQFGVYILHGAEDDNVPTEESRLMAEKLRKFHNDFIYCEQKGAGHWWDNSDEPGVDCVDWAPMFDFFARHVRPGKERINSINFRTSNPGISSQNYWLTIDAQIGQFKISSADVHFDPGLKRFRGTTNNAARLAFDLDIIKEKDTVRVELDSQNLGSIQLAKNQEKLWLELNDGKWAAVSEPDPKLKGAKRCGTIKEAFRNRMIFVYGTKGTKEENGWAFNKARYDAEKLWYQGNSSIDVISDIEYKIYDEPDRNIILYGNRNTNTAWDRLLSQSPVQAGSGYIKIGSKKLSGNNLCCIFVRPRPGSATASIAAVSGTGIVGMRVSNRLPYLNPGIGLPDCTVFSPKVLTEGESGVLFTGFFGSDWSLEKGEFIENFK